MHSRTWPTLPCRRLRVVWCGVVWCGVVWCGVVWCGVVRCDGVAWRGLGRGVLGCAGVWYCVVGWGGVWGGVFSYTKRCQGVTRHTTLHHTTPNCTAPLWDYGRGGGGGGVPPPPGPALSAQISATTKRGCRPWAGSPWGPGNRGADLLLPLSPPTEMGPDRKQARHPPPPAMPSHPHCRPTHGDRGPSPRGKGADTERRVCWDPGPAW